MYKKPTIAIVSDCNFLSLSVLENLLSKNCIVFVLSDDHKKWDLMTGHVKSPNFFIKDLDSSVKEQFDYTVFIEGFSEKRFNPDNFYSVFISLNNNSIKSIVLFPSEVYSEVSREMILENDKTAVIYVSDLIGPRINLYSHTLISVYLKNAVFGQEVEIPIGELIYPVSPSQISKLIRSWIFSFGPFGKETLIVGKQVSAKVFFEEVKRHISYLQIKTTLKKERVLPKGVEKQLIEGDMGQIISDSCKWIAEEYSYDKSGVSQKLGYGEEKRLPASKSRLSELFSFLFFILISPLIFIAVSCVLFGFSFLFTKNSMLETASGMLSASKVISNIAFYESKILKTLPLAGIVYGETYYISSVLVKGSDLGKYALLSLRASQKIFTGMVGNEVYDPTEDAGMLSTNLLNSSSLLKAISNETEEASRNKIISAAEFRRRINLEKHTLLLKEGANISANLPEALGVAGKKTYLVLFQNNMELRPTGGFIGSYGLMTFDKGRMVDFSVSDVYSADGQLKGHVEPPDAIKKYLKEGGWYLRDSNWDPDFPTSAKRAEWFLDKEIDKKVDGVVGIDLYPVRNLLKVLGPVYLGDYELSITPDNLYEKIQAEVEDEFFPGSYKKASFLTALSRNLMSQLTALAPEKKLPLLSLVIDSLNTKHIQIYLHNGNLQNSFYSLGYSGTFDASPCGENCLNDFVGLVEANVGVNKANYFIERALSIDTVIENEEAVSKASLTLQNSGNPKLGPASSYKAYVRFLIPENSTIINSSFKPEIYREKGRLEVGFYLEVVAGSEANAQLTWSNKLEAKKLFRMSVIKQAGTEADPLKVGLENRGLTPPTTYQYNTSLATDFVSPIYLIRE